MERGSSKHGPELDEQMEGEDESILRTGQPARTEEWREPEPFAPEHLDLELPEDQEPGVPRGMTTGDVELRSDIARWLPPHKLPEGRHALLEFLQHEGAPDDVVAAIGRAAGRAEVPHDWRDRPHARHPHRGGRPRPHGYLITKVPSPSGRSARTVTLVTVAELGPW